MEAAHRASSTSVSSAARHRGSGLDVAEPLLQAYRTAALVVSSDCHLPVSLLAAIGQVESGNLRGHRLDAGHRAVPRVRGPVLDGDPFGRVPDTDDGVLDGDRTWDRAVGPMQFLPATWIAYAVDLDGDGRLDPQDVEDAAGSAAVYLCHSGGDLADPASLRKAVLTYNHSRAYLRLVLAWRAAYDEAGLTAGSGLAALPALLVRPGPAAFTSARTAAGPNGKGHGTRSKEHATSKLSAGPGSVGTGRDPVRSGGAWSQGTVDQPLAPSAELPPCVTDPPVTTASASPSASESPSPSPSPSASASASASPSPSPSASPTPEPSDPPQVTCEPQAPGDPTAPADPATGTDPEDPQPETCGACAP